MVDNILVPSFTFVSASPTFTFMWQKNIHNLLITEHRKSPIKNEWDVKYDLYCNNKEGLSKIYNRAFEKANTDYVICLHDDIVIHDIEIFEKIIRYSTQYDVMGLAGSSSFNINIADRKSWMQCSMDKQRHLHGSVTHDIPGYVGFYNTSTYGYMPAPVCNIDGLFMVMKKDVYKNVKFDEQFTFDFYDLDYSLAALVANFKLGVIPLPCTHKSGGYGIMEDKYLTAQALFVEKWKNLCVQTV